MSRRTLAVVAGVATFVALLIPAATADEPFPPEAPVLHDELARGSGTVTALAGGVPVPKTVDGGIDDWTGEGTGFGGTLVRSHGELIYTDHLFDAYGADDGADAERLSTLDPLAESVPETYRLDPVFQADVAGQLGAPTPDAAKAKEHYGDAERRDAADLVELRLAADDDHLFVLARTTTMTDEASPAVVLLLDTDPHRDEPSPVPFDSGITTDTAEVAVLVTPAGGRAVDLRAGGAVEHPVQVASDSSAWNNAIEAAIPRTILGETDTVAVAAASGVHDGAGGLVELAGVVPNLANVAFRTEEPVRTWFDKQQALALHAGSIDPFSIDVDLAALVAGAHETWEPGPGYHDRVFVSSEAISDEGGHDGIWQHYGVYVPAGYDGTEPAPMTMWLHWRGGKAHSAATVSPRVMRDFGDGRNGIVVAPRGRGTSEWWIGEGMADVLEVWDDATSRFAVDDDRVAVSGHSMGGWGSYLLSILMPDRFAAALPVAGPVTQGAWTGVDFEGCDEMRWEEYTPCYVETNNGTARVQHTRPLLDNLRNTPIAIFQGAIDELVPTSGVTRQVERLIELGYRHRYYVFPTYEHYSHPVIDEWMELARYADAFVRPDAPERVTYIRDMAFERRVEQGNDAEDPVVLSFDFDRAWWMSGLEPVDPSEGVARFDGRSLALAGPATLTVPEAGGPTSPGQVGPYAMTGLGWMDDALSTVSAANAFEVSLGGARAVSLDLAAMGIDTASSLTGSVSTEAPMELRLVGAWTTAPAVLDAAGQAVPAVLDGDVLTVSVDVGESSLTVIPAGM